MGYTCIFSFRGSKSRIAYKYPKPKHDLIIEPFAGGGAYSLHHASHQVLLTDIDTRVSAIWNFLLLNQAQAIKWIRQIPIYIEQGTDVRTLIPDAPYGLLEILRSNANMGTFGTRQTCNVVTSFGWACWYRLRHRLLYWLPKIKHWTFVHQDYRKLKNKKATWFIDPPYNNSAGRSYKHHDINYKELSTWCQSLKGQVIVCENEGASWLPFKLFSNKMGILSQYQKSRKREVIWLND